MDAQFASQTTTLPRKIFKSSNEFSLHIEKTATEKSATYLATLLEFCDEHDLEPESVGSLVNKSLKDKLEIEYASMGMLKKQPSIFDIE